MSLTSHIASKFLKALSLLEFSEYILTIIKRYLTYIHFVGESMEIQ
jgi:hypothetical protein